MTLKSRKKSLIVFSFDNDNVIGDTSLYMHAALAAAIYTNKKVVFLKKRFVFPFNKLVENRYKPLSALYNLRSEYIEDDSGFILLSHLLGFLYSICFLWKTLKYRLLKIRTSGACAFVKLGHDEVKNIILSSKDNNSKWKNVVENGFSLDQPASVDEECCTKATSLGIDHYSWFVCLHIRTHAFRNDKNYRGSQERNNSPSNYIKAIQAIVARGGAVVRVGDKIEGFLPETEGLIEYPNSEYKSLEMDIHLIKNCKFFIGAPSGVVFLAQLFNKPCLWLNQINYAHAIPLMKNSLIVYQLMKGVDGSKLKIQNCITETLSTKNSQLRFIENDAEEISEACEEMIKLTFDGSEEKSVMQNEMKIIHSEYIFKYLDKNEQLMDIWTLANLPYNGNWSKTFLERNIAK